ncbi:glycosyltransferase family 4 protein [Mitsuaria sp. GD03876]|uniref:glycosyltransferase family 4 protein n=1 Tax=Mitsuaria sp. GD03876 TaxID=2975399 RepID=UPI00244A0CA0|nr:glycosyltransferase family 4 protein [Mitsuaria sp. GD03876]MDH0868300.1 glycosyltransferase family 4 protein [Mitsuaria sp. GD03876]
MSEQSPITPATASAGANAAASATSAADGAPARHPRLAYLVNHYPKVSHTFIRREILAVERQGLEVLRLAIRGWDDDAPDPVDQAEKARTQYLLKDGAFGLVKATLAQATRAPGRFLAALKLALRMSRRADRPWPFHLVYLMEACAALPVLQRAGIEHLHIHFGTNPAEVGLLIEALGGPGYSMTVHGPEEFDRPDFLHLGDKIRGARFVAAITSFCRSQLSRWVAYTEWPKLRVVHCGLDPEFHAVQAPAPAGKRLVCVGRMAEQKGHLLLVEAAAAVARQVPDFELVLAGDGELRPTIERRVRELGLERQVRITGWIDSDTVRRELLAARALVLASFAEGLPVVIMEAMALGRPCVSTCIAGIPELIRDGENGWLLPAGDPEALAEAMLACLRLDDAELARVGQRARATALERHDIDREAARLVALFQEYASPAKAYSPHRAASGAKENAHA